VKRGLARMAEGRGEGISRMETNPFDYPCPYACEGPLDDLVAGGADHQGTPGVYRRK